MEDMIWETGMKGGTKIERKYQSSAAGERKKIKKRERRECIE